ncbi:MAG TPA: radical SAM protein, partial [Syntrophomonadaceae bacterium]|nr:radical SAM protein [Syntrophomonadaceae bacterium]
MINHGNYRGIYIHIPFCIAKCGYCDFYSVPIGRSMDWQEQYLRGLVAEMEQRASFYDGQRIITIYIGGGTPSLLTSEQIDRLLNKLAATFTLSSDIEITIEANPATVNEKYLQECRQAGVNRLSLGVQSFIDRELCLLGRLHSTQDSKEA